MSPALQESQNLLDAVDEELDIEEEQQRTAFDLFEIGQAIKTASEGALTNKTVVTYKRFKAISYFFFINC